jgi:hypothetical protein
MFYDDDKCREGCGNPIGVDGDMKKGRCRSCQDKADARNAKSRRHAAARREAMESIGMKRVRGNLGGYYWE